MSLWYNPEQDKVGLMRWKPKDFLDALIIANRTWMAEQFGWVYIGEFD